MRQTETSDTSQVKEARTGNVPELRAAEIPPEQPAAQRQRAEPNEAATGMFVVSRAAAAQKQVRFAEGSECSYQNQGGLHAHTSPLVYWTCC